MNIARRTIILLSVAVFLIAAAVGGYLWYGHAVKTTAGDGHDHGPTQYTCPMHPFIIKDKPGDCPICAMSLVPVKKADPGRQGESGQELPDHVYLSPSQMVMANVATVAVDKAPLDKEVSAVGIVQYDQSRQAKVTAWVAGRIDRLFVDTVGASVSRGRPVAEIYAPDLVAAQQEYLLALKSREQFKDSTIQAISQGGDGLVSSARQRLQLLGVKEYQIAALEKSGRPNIRLSIYTPLSGIVIEKNVMQGQYVNVGDPLFSIVDLSSVWVEAEVYESDFPAIKIGQKVTVSAQSYPGTVFTGTVSFIYPFLDPKTRTVKVRVQMANPGLRLKPEMFVTVSLKIPLGDALVVPVTAVMDSGKRKVVWVETKPGVFVPRDVQTGARVGDRVQILSGVVRGDKVAASGGYLIDSEAQLQGGSDGGHEGHGGVPVKEKPTGGAVPVPGKHDDMNMDDMNM
jgi:membrane fusion protein, copper/silver efflux system